MPTASELVYRELLDAATEEERSILEGQLVAIYIMACRRRPHTPPYKPLAPPYEWQPNPTHDYLKGRWVGGHSSIPSWVRGWVSGELSGEEPFEDGARYIGRRCVNALIDKIRYHERRKRGAQIRIHRRWENDPEELESEREAITRAQADLGLPDALPLEGDRSLLKRLIAAYPTKPSNVSIAREMGLSEGAVRKRRKRISEMCFGIADGRYQFCNDFEQLGLKRRREKIGSRYEKIALNE